MQTIKTAAIVVLMLTVLYGGYVSLTTPPEPLPDEIEEILVIEEAAPGFPDAEQLAAGLDLQEPPAGVIEPSPQTQPSADPQPADPQPADALNAQTPPPATTDAPTEQTEPAGPAEMPRATADAKPTFGSSFADLPPQRSADVAAKRQPPKKLPAVEAPAANVQPKPAGSYASTSGAFTMPDPQAAASSFDPDKGTPFEAATEFQLSDRGDDSTAADSIGASVPDAANRGLINAFATADEMYAQGELKEALATLSVFYEMPNLSDELRGQLLGRLDPLAREVIYSKRHLLEQPRRVGASETLVEIAKEYDVPWQLLANINGVEDPITVLPGTELKAVRGPFRAEVNLSRKQMTLFLGDLYAGRFDIEVGTDPSPTPGTFTIQEKRDAHVYYDRTGAPVPPESPDNPYGNMWLDLGGQISIHGSPNTVKPTDKGCISVAGDYADDVFGILSQGSTVTIRR